MNDCSGAMIAEYIDVLDGTITYSSATVPCYVSAPKSGVDIYIIIDNVRVSDEGVKDKDISNVLTTFVIVLPFVNRASIEKMNAISDDLVNIVTGTLNPTNYIVHSAVLDAVEFRVETADTDSFAVKTIQIRHIVEHD